MVSRSVRSKIERTLLTQLHPDLCQSTRPDRGRGLLPGHVQRGAAPGTHGAAGRRRETEQRGRARPDFGAHRAVVRAGTEP